MLYIFADNEAPISMIIKGRRPAQRHVSRTHRVALDWLFDRINLDTKIQIEYVDAKNQLSDISTKGNFTRDGWNHLFVYSTSALSALKAAHKRCRKDCKKVVVKKGLPPNRDLREIWYPEAEQGSQQCHFRRHLQARGISDPTVTNWI